jgi:hypothetical protein
MIAGLQGQAAQLIAHRRMYILSFNFRGDFA